MKTLIIPIVIIIFGAILVAVNLIKYKYIAGINLRKPAAGSDNNFVYPPEKCDTEASHKEYIGSL